MTTTTIRPPAAAPTRGNALAAGWVPVSPLPWLEELRDEHERLASAWRFAAKAATAVRDEQIALRAAHIAGVDEAARAGTEPPALPGRLDPEYQCAQLDAAAQAEADARADLDNCVARVGSAVGARRLGDKWRAATTVEADAKASDPSVSAAARLAAFEAQWCWPPIREPGPTLADLDAEVKAATDEVQRLTARANARLYTWRDGVDAARAAGEPRPRAPDLDDELMARTHAETRLQRAQEARDRATRRGVIA